MINSELLEKLNAMSAEVAKLETEAQRTADNVEEQIEQSRNEKQAKIVEFLCSLKDTFKIGGFTGGTERNFLCCGNHWEGKPNASGSHCRSIGVAFRMNYDGEVTIHIGRLFEGHGRIDKIIIVNESGMFRPKHLPCDGSEILTELRANFIDRWTEETERGMSEWMTKIVKENLQKRIETATQKLKEVNDKHDEYFKGE